MSVLTLFILEITISFGISLVVVWFLNPLLTDVLIETCGTERRAAFWAMFTQLMLYLAPLLIVIYFAPTNSLPDGGLVPAIRDVLFRTLLGVFIALASIGQVVWKSIKTAPQKQASQAISED